MIDAAKGLLKGMEKEGAIPFKEFKTTYSTTKFLNGFYNTKMGDIYIHSEFVIRGDHSRVTVRVANYFINCINPAFGVSKEVDLDDYSYLEVLNAHSAIYQQDFKFPSPLTNRETITDIVWKRVSEKCVVISFHPLASHAKIQDKYGQSVIRVFSPWRLYRNAG
ncbi:hypothetical protein TrLO_g10747 [Triparma laevis f. longispina]|uniref:Uncharacterized protein n=1 Tax=Triparma laevis f. longispina TaxID=1714387 RepID=A0A9W6ZSY3_9STRA|nr:hypothetical protein TrLO_g10747 [Triparma laevis f. longispina]